MATESQSQTENSDPYSNLYAVFPSYVNYIEQQLGATDPAPDKPIFEKSYKVKSLQDWDEKKATGYEMGNRIIAPDGDLHTMVLSNNIETELIIQIINPKTPKKLSHCSVLEWTAPKDIIYVPSWMIKDFGLQTASKEQPQLTLKYYKKPFLKGSIVQIQPHKLASVESDEFKDVQRLFEKSLKKYQCLTVGDTLRIEHNKNVHLFEVTDVLSAQSIASVTPFNCVSIINTDVTIDFLPPKDLPTEQVKESRIDGYAVDNYVDNTIDPSINKIDPPIDDTKEEPNAFSGTGNRLDTNTNEMKNNDPFGNIEGEKLVIDQSQPKKRIQITFIGNKREVVQVNETTTVKQIYAHCKFVSAYDGQFQLLAGFPPKPLTDPDATVKDENLGGSRISQKAL